LDKGLDTSGGKQPAFAAHPALAAVDGFVDPGTGSVDENLVSSAKQEPLIPSPRNAALRAHIGRRAIGYGVGKFRASGQRANEHPSDTDLANRRSHIPLSWANLPFIPRIGEFALARSVSVDPGL
jgi:hypothetical protein